MTLFPNLSGMLIEQVHVAHELTFTMHATSSTAPCPSCGTISKRVQSRYTRTLCDLPSSGRLVHLVLRVRRFFCCRSTCSQKIFAEQFPALVLPRAQHTKRLQEALCQLGFALGGQAGARVGNQLSFSGSRDTILRLVRQSEQPPVVSPRIIGIDDWAWKRSLRYGTLIYDLERQMPLDLFAVKRD
jgi:transposase